MLKINRYITTVKYTETLAKTKIGEPIITNEGNGDYVRGFISNVFEDKMAVEICLWTKYPILTTKDDTNKRFLYYEENFNSNERLNSILKNDRKLSKIWADIKTP